MNTRNIIIAFFALLSIAAWSQEAQRADSMIVRQLEAQGVQFSTDNSVTLLTTGQEKFDDMFQAVRHARSSIHMDYFNFRNDSISHALFDLLEERAAAGVEVRIIFDDFGNLSNNQPLKTHHLKALREKGIQIYIYSPVRFPWVNHISPRDHRKIVVIDGHIAYTGGMNVADYYIKGTEQVGEWHDMHCRIEGREVNRLQRLFFDNWQKVTGESLSGTRYFRYGTVTDDRFATLRPDTTPTAGRKMVGIINRAPRSTHKIIRTFYRDAINDAQDSIYLISPYFCLNGSIKRALKNALKRGVKIKFMIGQKSDIPLTPDCAFHNAHWLMKHGAEVWIYKPGFHHTKVIMVDGRFCTVGSANLDSRSLYSDLECNAVIIDPHTTQQLIDLFNRDTQRSFRLTEESWKAWRTPGQRRLGWWTNLLMRPFL